MRIISVLRHETASRILTALVKKPQTTHKDLAIELNISSQALSWQIDCLEKMGFIKREAEPVNVKYSLDEAICAAVSQCVTLLELETC
jgi:DNA-binding MarR family transcriptional regulator